MDKMKTVFGRYASRSENEETDRRKEETDVCVTGSV